ncbi:hypothetical protein D3C87_1439360 [compost metagenome]
MHVIVYLKLIFFKKGANGFLYYSGFVEYLVVRYNRKFDFTGRGFQVGPAGWPYNLRIAPAKIIPNNNPCAYGFTTMIADQGNNIQR